MPGNDGTTQPGEGGGTSYFLSAADARLLLIRRRARMRRHRAHGSSQRPVGPAEHRGTSAGGTRRGLEDELNELQERSADALITVMHGILPKIHHRLLSLLHHLPVGAGDLGRPLLCIGQKRLWRRGGAPQADSAQGCRPQLQKKRLEPSAAKPNKSRGHVSSFKRSESEALEMETLQRG